MANYGAGGPQPPGFGEYPDYSESAEPPSELSSEPEGPPAPWYRNRWLLAVWATMVAILIVLIIYGLIQLSHGGGGGPSTTTPSTTTKRSSTTTPSTTTTNPSTTATPPAAPPTTSEEEQPPYDSSPAPAQPPQRHHHHSPHDLPHIPPTITLPHTVITLPPGW
jgi:cytoskeletal protein RodZ